MTRVNWGLLLQQSLGAIWGRKMRSVMTAFGITVGILVFLVTLGWSLSASADINATFDERTAALPKPIATLTPARLKPLL